MGFVIGRGGGMWSRNAAPAEVRDAIVGALKELADAGQFDGPFSAVAAEGVLPLPSRAAIARILSRGPVRPQARPQPRQAQIDRTQAGSDGTVSRPGASGQVQVPVGGRYKQSPVTALQDGTRVAIFSGTTLIRAPNINPSTTYQPPTNQARARDISPAHATLLSAMSCDTRVSNLPRHANFCQTHRLVSNV